MHKMWRYSCCLTLNVFYICILFCPLIASKGINKASVCREGTFESDPNNPEAYFQCLDGKILLQICPEESHFDPMHLVCVAKEDPLNVPAVATCFDGDLKMDILDCTGYYQCIAGEFVKLQCANGSFFNSTIKTCVIDVYGNCKGSCTDGLLTEHPDDCAEYFECIAGKFIEMKCPGGSYFNPELDSCVIDEDNICPTSLKEFIEEDEYEYEYEYDDEDEDEELFCSEGALEEDPDDLTIFFKCIDGEFLEFSCPNGHFFDINTKTCLFDGFLQGCTEGDLKEDLEDSETYFMCINGQFVKKECPSEQFFDSILKKCIIDDEFFD